MKTILAALVVAAILTGIAAPIATAIEPTPPPPAEEMIGGRWYMCPAYGILFGVAVATGQLLAAGGALVGAMGNGCI